MLAVWSFLAAVLFCVLVAILVYFIFTIRLLVSILNKLLPASDQITGIFPFVSRISALIPDLIESIGKDARRTEELKNTFDQFLKFAIVSRGPAAETDNDSGFYHTTDAEAASREAAEQARKLGVSIPTEPEMILQIPKRQ